MAKAAFQVSASLFRKSLLTGLMMLGAACSTDSHRALLPIEVESTQVSKTSWAQQAEDLERILKADPKLRLYVEDLVEAVAAEVSEEREQWAEASTHWLNALKIDRGNVGKRAFERWALVQIKVDPATGNNPDALARILLAATKEGEDSAYLKKQSLTKQAALAKKLQGLVAEKVLGPVVIAPLPTPDSFPESDFLWEARSKAVCKKNRDAKWLSWERKLTEGERQYWDGLLAQCEGESKKAVALYSEALSKLTDSPEDRARSVRAAELYIQVLKAIGDRRGATEAYHSQSQILKRSDLPLDLLKWTPYEKERRYVESLYWVARNRAMEGDYERAKIAAREGLDVIPELERLAPDAKKKAEASELKIEGLHVIASRISYEQLDFGTALSLNKLALETPGITKEWRQRLLWSEGWYEYRKGDNNLAVVALDRFLADGLDDGLKTKALYWKGRALFELGKKSEAEDAFEEVQKLSPLSFYSIVAVPLIDPDVKWNKKFKGATNEKLSKFHDFDWGAYLEDPEAMKRFHRLEISLAAKLKSYQADLGQELFNQINGRPKLIEELEPSLYATRLLHMAEQYILTITLTAQINQKRADLWEEYPEQLLIFFPTPYRADVARFAGATNLDNELVWGLSRQESSFRPGVLSPVGAIGLMQLMPNTAQEQARALGLSTSSMAERLKTPELNLQLGTYYLSKLGSRYQKKWPRAIAAYNAGEYVVDTWLARRDATDMVVWAEGLSFGETSSYVKNVWRNWEVYKWLNRPE